MEEFVRAEGAVFVAEPNNQHFLNNIDADILEILLKDKTTGNNIIWATDVHADLGSKYTANSEITSEILSENGSNIILPNVWRQQTEQKERTRNFGEVCTPSWLCNIMLNNFDEEWFGRKDVFNIETLERTVWKATEIPVVFPADKDWQMYVDTSILEITCGEAPFLVSRYDTSTGQEIPLKERIGALDRKMRIVNENTDNHDDWFKWAVRALQSVYGYEYQGDNLLIARINVLMSFIEYSKSRWGEYPSPEELSKVANIIAWNLWQMDGLRGTVPIESVKEDHYSQLSLFAGCEKILTERYQTDNYCKVFDWESNKPILFKNITNEV